MHDFDQVISRRGTNSSKWDTVPEGTIPLYVADMDFRSPQCVIDALKKRADHGFFGYTFAGDDFFEAVCGWQKRIHGCTVKKEEIVPVPGVITGLQWSMKALTPTGGCVTLLPAYPPFLSVPQNLDKPLTTVTLSGDSGRWELDLDALEKELAREDVNAFILCNPHNPVGRAWTEEELCRMLSRCKKHGVTVYSDEIHGDIVMPGETFTSVLSLPEELAGQAVVLNAPSKTFNLPGLQTSCIIVRDPEQRRKISELLGRSHIPGPSIMGFTAAAAAYSGGEQWVREMNQYVSENFDLMAEFFARELPSISFHRPEATYLAWLDCRKTGLTCKELDEKFRAAGVSLGVGTNFGETAGEGFMRFTAACPRELLTEALKRMKQALE